MNNIWSQRTFFVFASLFFGLSNAHSLDQSYRSQLMSDIVPKVSSARLFKSPVTVAESGYEVPPIVEVFMLAPGEKKVYDFGVTDGFHSQLTITGRAPNSNWEKEYKDVVLLGYKPSLLTQDFRLEDGIQFQAGMKSVVDRADTDKPFCVVEFLPPELMSSSKNDPSNWPKLAIQNVGFDVQAGLSVLTMGLINPLDESEMYSIKCFSKNAKQAWTVGLIEDTFMGRLVFQESKFNEISKQDFPLISIKDLEINVLKQAPDNFNVIQYGTFKKTSEMSTEDFLKPFCVLSGLDLDHKKWSGSITATEKIKVNYLSGVSSSEVIPFGFMEQNEKDVINISASFVTKKSGFANFVRLFNKNYGGFSLYCRMPNNGTQISLEALNQITDGFVQFKQK